MKERTSKLISALQKEEPHHHQWDILSETTTESPMEQFQRLGGTNLKTGPGVYTDPIVMFRKKHIQIMTCECGAIQRFVTEI